jgi:CTP synthase
MAHQTKYIFVTGGVTSSLGKGIIAASLAKLLQGRGHSVTIQKLDPYINIDPGTLNPYEHGECYVTDDGAETDLDLGHYERFLNVPTSQANNITTGRIYQSVINKERKGEYLGKTVQVIPHVTDEIIRSIKILGEKGTYDFVITEIGGTVGDIESLPYIEAVRQMCWESKIDCLVIHLTLIPYLSAAGELKTKPTQHSVKELLKLGVQPDILVCRTEHPLNDSIKKKVALFCNVAEEAVIESMDAETIYDVPLLMQKERLDDVVLKKLNCEYLNTKPDLTNWNKFLKRYKNPSYEVRIAIVGKYTELADAYKSIVEGFNHAGAEIEAKLKVKWVQSDDLTEANVERKLNGVSGVLVAPGFGDRGIEGKIATIKYVRENNIPFLGICLGMQCAVIEFARNVLGLEDAHSLEMNKETTHPVINLMESQKEVTNYGGTMRLGAYDCAIEQNTLAYSIYQNTTISERHRHRFEFNNEYKQQFIDNGMVCSGLNSENNLVEIVELPSHPFFIGVQFHPEYKSTVANPHPLFVALGKAALAYKKEGQLV